MPPFDSPLLSSPPPLLSPPLSVTDSLDDVLKIADKKKSPPKKVSPLNSRAKGGLFEVDDKDDSTADMEGGDIMKYIQQNMEAANGEDEDLDLF